LRVTNVQPCAIFKYKQHGPLQDETTPSLRLLRTRAMEEKGGIGELKGNKQPLFGRESSSCVELLFCQEIPE